MRIILKGAVFLLSLILCFIIIARIAAAPAKEKPVEDTYNDASSTVSIMWNGRVDRCYVKEELVELVQEELLERTNYECVFFTAGGYSDYGVPMFQECCHYFSSYD